MREFPQDALASRLLERGELDAADIDALAAEGCRLSRRDRRRRARRRVRHAGRNPAPRAAELRADRPAAWTTSRERERDRARSAPGPSASTPRAASAFLRRREQGFVRECHGDLHLGNIARIDGELVIFDCIEFNEAMRWIDVMSEVAFTVMDLRGPRTRRSRASFSECVSRARPATTRGSRCCRSISRTARWFAPRSRCCARRRPGGGASASRTPSPAAICDSRGGTREPPRPALDRHLRALRLRQDDDFAGVAGGDRRGSRPQRRRAQADARRRSARAGRRARRAGAVCAGGDRDDLRSPPRRLRATSSVPDASPSSTRRSSGARSGSRSARSPRSSGFRS